VASIWALAITYMTVKFYRLNNYIIGRAKAWATIAGRQSGEARKETQRERVMDETKGKLIDALSEELPFGDRLIGNLRKSGVSDNELFIMATDPDVWRVINNIGGLAKGALDGAKGLFKGDPEKKKLQDWKEQYKYA
jgi:hypothetical protein